MTYETSGTEYYYIHNAQGDVIGLFNGSGTEVVSYKYDSWGKLTSVNGSLASTVGLKNPYRYRGYRYDTETGLYYLQSRYYNPEWGRFLNADVLLGDPGDLLSHNIFAYCSNNPVNRFDPDGEAWWVIGGAVVGGTIGAYVSYRKHGTVKLSYVVGGAAAGALLTAGVGAAASAGKAYLAGSASVATGANTRVIGHYPEYVLKAKSLGARYFTVPADIWNKMTETERWTANVKILDRAIAQGAEFLVSTPLNNIKQGSYLEREIKYLLANGYKLVENGSRLIKR